MLNFPNKQYKNLNLYSKNYIDNYYKIFNKINFNDIVKVCDLLEKNYKEKKSKVLVCGNGGSAALSDHFACDHQKILSSTKKYKPIIISLCSNNSILTAIANDIGYEDVFSEQIQQISNKKNSDLLIIISASGKSKNVINAIKTAKKHNMKIISLTGFDGGKVKMLSDANINVSSNNYGIIESIHHSLMNIISQYLRQKVLTKKEINKINF